MTENDGPIKPIETPRSLDELSEILSLLGNLTRLRVIAALSKRPMFIQELSSELKVSYPLLHLHLKNMEKHGLVKSEYAVGTDKSTRYVKRYFTLVDFRLEISADLIARLAATDTATKTQKKGKSTKR
ncbi:MAG: ArsR/SmtB family transcription factor [Candidatus Thorarchaeota archaeon]